MYRNVFEIFYIPFDVVKKEAKDSFLQTASHHMKYSDSIVLGLSFWPLLVPIFKV